MAVQSIERRRCLTCNRWGGQRTPGAAPDTIEYDEHNDRGPCQEGPWHGNSRGPRNACGQWVKWSALDAPAPAAPADPSAPSAPPEAPMSTADTAAATSEAEFLVACLCADWCGTCRDYRSGFEALAARFPTARFVWLDVEDESELLDDYDVDNFPTLLIQRGEAVLFFGTMLPHHELLQRTVESFQAQSAEESRRYAHADPLRQSWQEERNLRRALAARGE